MKKIIISLLMLIIQQHFSYGQEKNDFKTVDSLASAYFLAGAWQNLADLGEKNIADGMDYYRLNLQTGFAFYQLKAFYTAEKYLKKALQKNSYSEDAKLYLAWTYLNMGDELRAAQYLTKEKKFAPTIYAEAGSKISSATNFSPMNIVHLGMGHQIKKRFNLFGSYSFLAQNQTIWGGYTQQQIYLRPTANLGKDWEISADIFGSIFNANVDYTYQSSYFNQKEGTSIGGMPILYDTAFYYTHHWKGSMQQNTLVAMINVQKTFGRLKITPAISVMRDIFSNNYTNNMLYDGYARILQGQRVLRFDPYYGTIPYPNKTSATETFIQGGLSLYYTAPLLRDAIGIGLKAYIFYSSNLTDLVPMPFVNIRVLPNWYANISYLQKGFYPISDGSLLLNNYNSISYRYTATNQLIASKKTTIFLTHQFEKQTDFISLTSFQFYSIFLGLKLKL